MAIQNTPSDYYDQLQNAEADLNLRRAHVRRYVPAHVFYVNDLYLRPEYH